MNPILYERTKDGETYYDIHSKLIKDRTIFISEELTDEVGGTVAALLLMLDSQDNESKITMWLKTPGGSTDALFAIYDVMQMIKSPIETICIGNAESAGALLLASGSKGMRAALPNSSIMIHQVQVPMMPGGSGSDVDIFSKEIKNINNKISEILARHTGQKLSKVKKDCNRDTYLTAKEALNYGIIDRILPYNKEIPPLIK